MAFQDKGRLNKHAKKALLSLRTYECDRFKGSGLNHSQLSSSPSNLVYMLILSRSWLLNNKNLALVCVNFFRQILYKTLKNHFHKGFIIEG